MLWWLKCTMLYFEFTLPYLYGTREIWTGLPSYYHETSKLLRAATNVIYCFLTKVVISWWRILDCRICG